MAEWYLYDSGDNDPGYGPTDRTDPSQSDNWTNAFTTLATAQAAMSNGDVLYIASDHAETISAHTVITAGALGSSRQFVSIDRTTGAYETMQNGGGSLNLAGGSYRLSFSGWNLVLGLKALIGDDLSTIAGLPGTILRDCLFEVNDDFDFVSSNNGATEFHNVDYVQKTAGKFDAARGSFKWIGGSFSISGGSVNTNLFDFDSTDEGANIYVEGVDFQHLDSGDYLISEPIDRSIVTFVGCKVPSAMGGLVTGTIVDTQAEATFLNVSSADIQLDIAAYRYCGLVTDETSIYLGASEKALEFDCNSNVEAGLDGLKYTLFRRYCSANPTLTVEMVCDEATALTDNDVWLEIYGPDDTTGALSLITTTKASDIINPTTLTSSSETWTGTSGFTDEQKRKISKALTGYQAGIYRIDVVVAKDIVLYADLDVTVA